MLTVGSIIQEKAIDIDYQGQGIVRYENYVIFVPGMLKDEVANIQIKTLKKRFAEGFIVSMVSRSPHRRDHKDLQYGSMDLLHMDDESQLQWQVKTTKDTLLKVGQLDAQIEPIITDHHFTHYRNKSVFHVMNHPQLTLGLFHINQSGLVPITSFLLADEVTNHILSNLLKTSIKVDASILKHIAIRTNRLSEALVTLIALNSTFDGLDQLVDALADNPYVIGVTLNIKDHPKMIFGSESFELYGENKLNEELGNYVFPITDRSFFQVNVPVIIQAYDLIKKHLKSQAHVLELYSGVGSIGYFILDKIKTLTMIESNQDAIYVANQIKDNYHLDQVHIIEGQAEAMEKKDADVLIVDPPRSGLQDYLVDKLIEKPFEQIFYLSCDLKTLARDLAKITTSYHMLKVYPIRMFPQTTECETLVILNKK